MPDIFGRNISDYQHYRDLTRNQVDIVDYLNTRAVLAGNQTAHDFNALQPRLAGTRNADNAAAVGYASNNMEAVMGMMEEILYTEFRLNEFIPLISNVPEGAQTYAYRVVDHVGQGEFIDTSGSVAPSATATQRLVPYPLHYAGIVPEWTLEDLRRAMMGGIALDRESVRAATTGCLDHIERVGLVGDTDRDLVGLTNLSTTGDNAVTRVVSGVDFDSATPAQIVAELQKQIVALITSTKEVFGRTIRSGLCVYMPITQADIVENTRLPDIDKTIWEYVQQHNAWTKYTGETPKLKWVQELDNAGTGNTDRMIIALNSERVMEMAIPISPRPITTMYMGFKVCMPVEYKISGLNVKRPQGIRYVDQI